LTKSGFWDILRCPFGLGLPRRRYKKVSVTIYDRTIEKVVSISWVRGVIAMSLEDGGLFVWDGKKALVAREDRNFALKLVGRCETLQGVTFNHDHASDGVETWTRP